MAKVESFAQHFYREAKEYQKSYGLSEEWLGFSLGFCLYHPMVASSMIPELLDLSRTEHTRILGRINE